MRPPAPRRAWTMAIPLIVGVGIGVAGAMTAQIAYGLLWGVIIAAGALVGLWLGKVGLDNLERAVLAAGLIASAVLSYVVMPAIPEDVDVLISLYFAAAWAPAAVATALVLRRRRVAPANLFTSGFAWILAGAFALPAAETIGVLVPLSSLRRGVDPVFGAGDYAAAGVFALGIGLAAFYAAITRLPALAVSASVILFTIFAGAAVHFDIPLFFRNLANVDLAGYWPPDWEWAIGETGTWWWPPSWEFGAPQRANPLVETLRIAVVASFVGCALALPLSFLASSLTAPNKKVYLAAKGFMNLIRTMPDLFWAVLFVAALGIGAFAGTVALVMFSLAIMSKLFSETIDDAKPGPLEAARATGSRHFPAVRSSVLPEVLPNYVAYALYVFELNLRASAIIGFVGAGGIGRVLEAQRVFYQYDRIMAIVILIVLVVLALERISVWLRGRLV
ncbi:MAG TPA: phosphonate ABC transporter, permease protein PhnE [Acidimicrobiia bacterium]